MARYSKKTDFVEALQWDGTSEVSQSLLQIHGSNVFVTSNSTLMVTTPEGPRLANVSDWIVTDSTGATYPLVDDIFSRQYERLQE